MESRLKKLKGEYDSLKQRRDELRLQAHLFNSEVKKEWGRLEKDWKIISCNVKETKPALYKSAEPIIQELRDAYERIKTEIEELDS